MKIITVVFIGLAFGLAACAQSPETSAQKSDQRVAAVPKRFESLAPKQQTPPPVAAVTPRILLEPTVVVGKTTAEIQKAFGDPNLRRKDNPAEVWQYLTRGCALHLFFYPSDSGDALVVRHIAINGRSVASLTDIDQKQCFNDHLKALGAEEAFIAKKAS